jgi:hypothetical protein
MLACWVSVAETPALILKRWGYMVGNNDSLMLGESGKIVHENLIAVQ